MQNLLLAVDMEARYTKWATTDPALANMSANEDLNMRKLFTMVYSQVLDWQERWAIASLPSII